MEGVERCCRGCARPASSAPPSARAPRSTPGASTEDALSREHEVHRPRGARRGGPLLPGGRQARELPALRQEAADLIAPALGNRAPCTTHTLAAAPAARRPSDVDALAARFGVSRYAVAAPRDAPRRARRDRAREGGRRGRDGGAPPSRCWPARCATHVRVTRGRAPCMDVARRTNLAIRPLRRRRLRPARGDDRGEELGWSAAEVRAQAATCCGRGASRGSRPSARRRRGPRRWSTRRCARWARVVSACAHRRRRAGDRRRRGGHRGGARGLEQGATVTLGLRGRGRHGAHRRGGVGRGGGALRAVVRGGRVSARRALRHPGAWVRPMWRARSRRCSTSMLPPRANAVLGVVDLADAPRVERPADRQTPSAPSVIPLSDAPEETFTRDAPSPRHARGREGLALLLRTGPARQGGAVLFPPVLGCGATTWRRG
jgi:hypothetical protein